MSRLAATLLCLLAFAACRQAEQPATPVARTPEAETELPIEDDNLLNLVFGAAVVDRSNENSYDTSIVHALDGTRMSAWASAPGGRQTAVLSLPTATRIERLGASIINSRDRTPGRLLFETSLDGTSWTKALETRLTVESSKPQLFDVTPPVDARYLRMTAVEPPPQSYILSLHAIGTETAPFVQPDIEGCWEINGEVPARFVRSGARVAGAIGPMIVDGGTNGRVYRLMWLEGAMWGYAAVTVTPDGQHLSGLRWHEEVNPKHSGEGWLGRRVPCPGSTAINTARIVDMIISRSSVWRLYGVRFDKASAIVASESAQALDLTARIIRQNPSHRFRIVARELREATEEKNRAICTARLGAIREALRARGTDLNRVELVVAGSERGPLSVNFTSMRVMDAGVELQVVPPR